MAGNVSALRYGPDRRHFIGGSDDRIIMGQDEKALIRLWQEKRGEVRPEDLSANLIVQLGVVTEDLNRVWYEGNGEAPRWRGGREHDPAPARISVRFRAPPLGFLETNSSAATVLVDEFDSSGLDRFPQSHSSFIRHFRTKASFKALDRGKREARSRGEFGLRPSQQATGSTQLLDAHQMEIY